MKFALMLFLLISTTVIQSVRSENELNTAIETPNYLWNMGKSISNTAYENTANGINWIQSNVKDASSSIYDYGVNTGTKLQSYMESAGSTLYNNGLAFHNKMQNIMYSTNDSIDKTINEEILPSVNIVDNPEPNEVHQIEEYRK